MPKCSNVGREMKIHLRGYMEWTVYEYGGSWCTFWIVSKNG
jgi:hypothetical protein